MIKINAKAEKAEKNESVEKRNEKRRNKPRSYA